MNFKLQKLFGNYMFYCFINVPTFAAKKTVDKEGRKMKKLIIPSMKRIMNFKFCYLQDIGVMFYCFICSYITRKENCFDNVMERYSWKKPYRRTCNEKGERNKRICLWGKREIYIYTDGHIIWINK